MFRDRFDRLHLAAAALVAAGILALVGGYSRTASAGPSPEERLAVERAMHEHARAAFLLDTFAPVEEMVAAGRYTEALLRLQELDKAYPGEPHTAILRGAALVAQEVYGEGLTHYAAAVMANGDYVDSKSPLNRRDEIGRLVEVALPRIRSELERNGSPALERSLRTIHYLQSRLAGGCE